MEAIIPRRGVPIFTPKVPVDGLIAEYLFENNFSDTSGNMYNGTQGSATYVDGVVEKSTKAATKQSASGASSIPTTVLKASSELSISFWFTMPPTNATRGDCLYFYVAHNWSFGWVLSVGATDMGGIPYVPNALHHVVAYKDPSNKRDLYVDGRLTLQGQDASYTGSTTCAYILCGSANGMINPFKGSLDNLRIYNRKLTEKEILALYNNGKGI